MNLLKRFGPHYAIERFGILFLSVSCCLLALVGFIGTRQLRANMQASANRALYTTEVTMSATDTHGYVSGVYVDAAQTKALLFVTFDDMSLLPDDADSYAMTVYGSTQRQTYEELESSPVGMIYAFPDMGYLALYLQDVGGFPDQIMCIRFESWASKEVAGLDYGLIFIDPGSSYATHASFLDTSDWTVFQMVEECMSRTDEVDLRYELKDTLEEMAISLEGINEDLEWLRGQDVVIPDLPVVFSDTVYAVAPDVNEDGSEIILEYSSDWGGGWFTSDHASAYHTNDVTVYLDSGYVLPDGFDFNWQDGRILYGYLEQLTGSDNLSAWEKYIGSMPDEEASQEWFSEQIAELSWALRDGTVINPNNPTSGQQDIADCILALEDELQAYYELKYQYECEELYQYLILEYQANSLFDEYTVNAGESRKVVTVQ